MKTIGLIGGTGWVSTVEYYRIINEQTNRKLGGHNYARCIIYSLNYNDIDVFNRAGNRDGVFSLILDAGKSLNRAGVDFFVLCANTLHQFADRFEQEIGKPLVHIADATALEIQRMGFSRVGLLGTRQTMVMDFYKRRLKGKGIEAIIPRADDREFIQNTINQELIKSIFRKEAKDKFLNVIDKLHGEGAQGIILGCTEIPLLINQNDTAIPLFNTLEIHAKAAAVFAIS